MTKKITQKELNDHLLYILPDYKECLEDNLMRCSDNYYDGDEEMDEYIQSVEAMLERVNKCLTFFYGEDNE